MSSAAQTSVTVDVAAVVQAAATSALGIIALLCILMAALGYGLFRGANDRYKLAVFGLAFVGAALLTTVLLREGQKQADQQKSAASNIQLPADREQTGLQPDPNQPAPIKNSVPSVSLPAPDPAHREPGALTVSSKNKQSDVKPSGDTTQPVQIPPIPIDITSSDLLGAVRMSASDVYETQDDGSRLRRAAMWLDLPGKKLGQIAKVQYNFDPDEFISPKRPMKGSRNFKAVWIGFACDKSIIIVAILVDHSVRRATTEMCPLWDEAVAR